MVYGYNADFERALVKNETTIDAIAQSLLSQLIAKRHGLVGLPPWNVTGLLIMNRMTDLWF